MKKSKMKATSLRTTMVMIIIITIILAGVGFYYAQSYLSSFATSITPTISKSTAGNNNPQATKKIQEEIAKAQTAVDKSNGLTSTLADYQNKVVKDLNTYASNNNITISDYKFATPAKVSGLADNIQSNTITITLGNPIAFTNLMKFFKSIETNLPKMQITGINLTRDPSQKDMVAVDPLIIETYIR